MGGAGGFSSAFKKTLLQNLKKPPRQVTDYQENVLGRRVTWPDLVCFQKITPVVRVQDELVDEEAALRIWMRDNNTSAKSEAMA